MQLVLLFAGAFLFLLGLLAGFGARHFLWPKSEPVTSTVIPRVKPSLRSPLKTFAVEYDKFKARDSGLYQPAEPKRSWAVK